MSPKKKTPSSSKKKTPSLTQKKPSATPKKKAVAPKKLVPSLPVKKAEIIKTALMAEPPAVVKPVIQVNEVSSVTQVNSKLRKPPGPTSIAKKKWKTPSVKQLDKILKDVLKTEQAREEEETRKVNQAITEVLGTPPLHPRIYELLGQDYEIKDGYTPFTTMKELIEWLKTATNRSSVLFAYKARSLGVPDYVERYQNHIQDGFKPHREGKCCHVNNGAATLIVTPNCNCLKEGYVEQAYPEDLAILIGYKT